MDYKQMAGHLIVDFVDVPPEYVHPSKISCKFVVKTGKSLKATHADRIVIFPVGWLAIKQHLLVQWVKHPLVCDEIQSVEFDGNFIDDNNGESFYQFCYITGDDFVKGISRPFQIRAQKKSISTPEIEACQKNIKELKETIELQQNKIDRLSDSSHSKCFKEMENLKQLIAIKNLEIEHLAEENRFLDMKFQTLYEENDNYRLINIRFDDLEQSLPPLPNFD